MEGQLLPAGGAEGAAVAAAAGADAGVAAGFELGVSEVDLLSEAPAFEDASPVPLLSLDPAAFGFALP